jgi:FtsH-binding integral membrane protein
MGGIVFGLAYTSIPEIDDSILVISLVAVTVLLYIAMLTFREQYGWNLSLLLFFSASLGSVFGLHLSNTTLHVSLEPFWFVIPCLAVAATCGHWIGDRFSELGVILWLVAWGYLLGWAVLIFLRLDPVFALTWSLIGLLLFTGLASVWFANMGAHFHQRSSVSAAINLYLICINLYIAALILQSLQL